MAETEIKLDGVTLETVKEFLEKNDDGKQFFNSTIDSKVSKAIETYKAKTLPKLLEDSVNDEISKRYPAETVEQKKLKELESKFAQKEKEANFEKLKNKAISYATSKNYPIDFIEKFIAEDEDSTITNVDSFGNLFNDLVKKEVEKRFKDSGRDVPNNTDDTFNPSPEVLAKMMSNPIEYEKNKTKIQQFLIKGI